MSVYTRTGDQGETSLFGGKRVLKCSELIDLYGLIDELNSSIGLIIGLISIGEVKKFLQQVQRDLFTIGSFIAGATVDFRHIEIRVKEMEIRIDSMDKTLTPLQHFILPGGTKTAAYIHIVRSVTRRAERNAVFVLKQCSNHPEIYKKQSEKIIQYFNRLSDFLFILARFVNKQENGAEMVWDGTKKENRV